MLCDTDIQIDTHNCDKIKSIVYLTYRGAFFVYLKKNIKNKKIVQSYISQIFGQCHDRHRRKPYRHCLQTFLPFPAVRNTLLVSFAYYRLTVKFFISKIYNSERERRIRVALHYISHNI